MKIGNIIRIEIFKALKNKWIFSTMLLLMLLTLYHSIIGINNFNIAYSYYKMGKLFGNPVFQSESLFCRWLGADVTSFETEAFYFFMPLVATLPFGWSLYDEIKSGYIKNILSRVNKSYYFIAKYVAVFLSGALVIIVPLICSVIILSAFIPAVPMDSIYPYGTIGQQCMWADLYYVHPYIYICLYILLDGLFAGLFATISVAVAMVSNSKVTVVIASFLIMLVWDYIAVTFIKPGEYSPLKFLQALPIREDTYPGTVIATALILFIITNCVYIYKEKKYEVL